MDFAVAVVCHKVEILLSKKSIPRVFQNPFLLLVKMRINQGYLLVLLLVSLSASCTSDCPTPEPYGSPYGQPLSYDERAKLYRILEAALLENPGNLYQLHGSFFPSSGSEPVYAEVTYYLNGYNHVCNYCTCWTSSVLLRSVDPVALISLQVELLTTLLETVGVSDLTADYYSYGAQLFLELNVTAFNPYDNNMDAVIQELTQWVSV